MSVRPPRHTSSAVLVYVVVLVSLQVFTMTVAVEAFITDDETLAWTTAGISAGLAALAAAFLRYLRA